MSKQGCSIAATPHKQEGFAKILGMIKGIAYHAAKNWENKTSFFYIDCNSGCGFNTVNEKTEKGSPLIAIETLTTHPEHKFDQLAFIFCDEEADSIAQLKSYCKLHYPDLNIYYFVGKNNSSDFFKIINSVGDKHFGKKKMYGLIYSDPNGSLDYPVDLINDVAKKYNFVKLDILVNFNTTSLKRNRTAFPDKPEHQRRHFKELIKIKKRRAFIRQYADPKWKFSHCLFTNYPEMPEYTSIQLFDMEKQKGKRLFEEVCFTQQEISEMNQQNQLSFFN